MANFHIHIMFLENQECELTKMAKFGFSSSIFCARIIYFHVQLGAVHKLCRVGKWEGGASKMADSTQ